MNQNDEILINNDTKGVTLVTLNRPIVKNAFSNSLITSLKVAFDKAEKDKDIKCIVLTGGKEVFAAGSDINQLKITHHY